MARVKGIIENTITVIAAAILIWFIMSYLEVIIKNGSPNPVYSAINALVLFTR